MHLLVYMSDACETLEDVDKEVADIVSSSKRHNAHVGITGVLFFHKGVFVQVLEGDKQSLDELMIKIEQDPRHTNLQYLVDRPISTRGFQDWNMDSFNLSHIDSLQAGAFRKVWSIYEKNIVPRSDVLVNMYKTLACDQTFLSAVQA